MSSRRRGAALGQLHECRRSARAESTERPDERASRASSAPACRSATITLPPGAVRSRSADEQHGGLGRRRVEHERQHDDVERPPIVGLAVGGRADQRVEIADARDVGAKVLGDRHAEDLPDLDLAPVADQRLRERHVRAHEQYPIGLRPGRHGGVEARDQRSRVGEVVEDGVRHGELVQHVEHDRVGGAHADRFWRARRAPTIDESMSSACAPIRSRLH